MAVKLRRPILVGGIALSFGLWLLESVHDSLMELGEFGVLGAIALGTGLWLFQQKPSKEIDFSPVASPLDRVTVEKAIAQAESVINQLETEADNQEASIQLRQRVAQLTTELDRQEIKLAVTGGKGVGKTSLIQVLESNWLPQQQQRLSLKETPALFVGADTDVEAETAAKEVALASDLVLFVTTGDLTDTEFQTVQQLRATNQRVMLVFNKQDQYLPTERATVLQQLRQRMVGRLGAEDVVAIASSPAPVKVRQHQPDASVQEWMEQQSPDLTALSDRLSQIVTQEGQQLVWASTMRAAAALKAEAKSQLNKLRRDRALPVIEQYQWIAAAAAFANPVPALDLLATAAISAQVVTDLGEIYQQKFSLQQAQAAAKTLGSLMLKLGLVELSTQTIGSILKGNAFTYVAGGAVQGVSAAYLTRLAGLSLIEYFQEQEQSEDSATGRSFNLERLGEKLQKVFQQNQRRAFLQGFVKQGLGRLVPAPPQSELAGSETSATAV
jgi:GTPase SAR1 family protein